MVCGAANENDARGKKATSEIKERGTATSRQLVPRCSRLGFRRISCACVFVNEHQDTRGYQEPALRLKRARALKRVPICERSSTTASVTDIADHTYLAWCVVIRTGGGGCVSGDDGAVDGAVSDGCGGDGGEVADGCVGVSAWCCRLCCRM